MIMALSAVFFLCFDLTVEMFAPLATITVSFLVPCNSQEQTLPKCMYIVPSSITIYINVSSSFPFSECKAVCVLLLLFLRVLTVLLIGEQCYKYKLYCNVLKKLSRLPFIIARRSIKFSGILGNEHTSNFEYFTILFKT